jgi:hypothetical protein
MAELTQELLQTILSNIFNIDKKHITLKQGNWFTPQSILINSDKPLTWVRHLILDDIPVTVPGYDTDIVVNDENEEEEIQVLVTQVITPVQLDFIGKRAEECAKSVKNWLRRLDVINQFETVNAKLMAVDRKATPFNYIQEGMASTLAYNSNFKLARKSVEPTGAIKVDSSYSVEIEGEII